MTDGFQHITAPRRTWWQLGLPRRNGLPDMPSHYEPVRPLPDPANWNPARNAVRRNKITGLYGVHKTAAGRYRVVFTTGMHVHKGGVYDDWYEAGQAHDDYVLDNGLDRPLNFAEGKGK